MSSRSPESSLVDEPLNAFESDSDNAATENINAIKTKTLVMF